MVYYSEKDLWIVGKRIQFNEWSWIHKEERGRKEIRIVGASPKEKETLLKANCFIN